MTKQQKLNLAKTALVMLESQIPIEMEVYFSNDDNEDSGVVPNREEYNKCGTCCCFAGFGPLAGLRSEQTRWDFYIEDVFTDNYREHKFLFETYWPNNKTQAAARALHLLECGVPEYYEYNSEFDESHLKEKLNQFI